MAIEWISHRGYQDKAVENTLRAFQAAIDLGFCSLETDLRITRDGHVILCHDPDLGRIAGTSVEVGAHTRDELLRLKLSDGSPLLFFDEFIETFSNYRWTFDIKPDYAVPTLEAMGAWALKHRRSRQIALQAKFLVWNRKQEQLVLKFFPNAAFYAGEKECWRAGLAVMVGLPFLGGIDPKKTYSLKPKLRNLSLFRRTYVERYRRRRAKVLAYLPETESETRAAMEAGFDEILTNGLILDL